MRYRFFLLSVLYLSLTYTLAFGASGELDRSFGYNGLAYFDLPLYVAALTVQADDQLLAGGSCSQAGLGSHFCITKLTINGSIDTTFGVSGTVITQMAPVGMESSTILKIIVLPDGKFIGAGYTERVVGLTRYNLVALARYLANGTLDTTFAQQGKFFDTATPTVTGKRLVDIVRQSDGKLVIVAGGPTASPGPEVVLMRLTAEGSLDPSFGIGGKASRGYGSLDDLPGSIAIGPDGKIIVGAGGTPNRHYVLERYLTNADYDSSAGQNGRVTFAPGSNTPVFRKVAVMPDGRTVAMGSSFAFAFPNIMLARFNQNLSFDTTFANAGRLDTNLAPDNSCDALDFQLGEGGRITLAANCSISSSTFNGQSQELARVRADGTLDPQFGNGGRIVNLFRSYTGQIAVQKSGKFVVCGRTTSQSGPFPGLFCERYLDNGTRESDFDADKKADVSVYRPSTGTWYANGTTTGFKAVHFGTTGDKIVPADYDGDGVTDQAVFRRGTWYQLLSGTNSVRVVNFGLADDIPLAADYTGDGKADIAVFRAGDWYFLDSISQQVSYLHFGIAGDKPIVGNFDADLKADPAVFRNGIWYMLNSMTGFSVASFGLNTDKPIAADYDGDGATDLAVYRSGVWYILGSSTGIKTVSFGLATDRPTPADYDGDGRADIAIYRDGIWYLQQSTAGFAVLGFGLAEDIPIPAAFLN